MIALTSQPVKKSVLAPIIYRFRIQPMNIRPAVDFSSRNEVRRRVSLFVLSSWKYLSQFDLKMSVSADFMIVLSH